MVSGNIDDVFVDLTDGKELPVNRIAWAGFWGSQHVIVLASNRPGVGPDGKLRGESALVARLRLDNDMAKILREALDVAIKSLEPPTDVKAN